VASKHKEAQTFLRKGFFEGLKSFREFEARTEKLANTKEVGDALEILVEAHLHLDQVLKAKNVWVVGDIPLNIRKSLNLPADSKGIDGVYEDASGNIIPYQVKYRTDKETLPYGEVSSFLGITEESLKDRVIFTNARNLAADITKRKGLRSFKAAQFHSLTEEDFNRIHAWLSDKKPAFKRWSPQIHQKEAIEKITAALKVGDRTTAVMACGTGKTLVALWAAEAQGPKTVLVLVPSLALLSQTLPDWCKQTSWGERFRYLCVCSDASVDRSAKEDEYALKQSDLEFSVTTDAKVVKDFLSDNRSGVNVIFSTYQSAEVVAKGLKGQTIDLGIFDEAHKTTGSKDGRFTFGLNDRNLSIKKRLFLTATPRHYKLSKRDKDGDFQTVSMSNEEIYGKVSYRLSFSAAVAANIIVPYKVIISVSLNKEVDAEILKHGSTIVRRDELQAKWVANQIALKRAIEKTKATKIITFHSRVYQAEDFAGDNSRGIKEHVSDFDVFHVNGGQNAADRKALLEDFKSAPRGLITNARCLTEGVDVPSVDMVAFIDPKKSKIDIAQAAGRAMRKATNKRFGYIVVPLFIEQKKGETEEQAAERSGFAEVAEVLRAMLENDDDLVDAIREMQEASGRGDKFNPRQLHEKIQVIGPSIDLEKLTRSIDVAILERLGVSWDRWFGLLQRFKQHEGHCLVPVSHEENGYKLGVWVSNQRHGRNHLPEDRLNRLNTIGFSWDPIDEQWEKGFEELKCFREKKGHCVVPATLQSRGFALGNWVSRQRNRNGTLDASQINRLNLIGFSWNPHEELWEKCYSELLKFRKREGHANVPGSYKVNGITLGQWAIRQRKERNNLSEDKIRRLDSIGFSWDPNSEQWEEAFRALTIFKKREGHVLVSARHKEAEVMLGGWVQTQRYNKSKLPQNRLKRLDSIGFIWDQLDHKWDKHFAALVEYHKREGHTLVPVTHTENKVALGSWVRSLRSIRNNISAERLKRLNEVNFTWEVHASRWDESLAALNCFIKREGHTLVPRGHVEKGIRLGTWTTNQRSQKSAMDPVRLRQLNDIDFSWDANAESWKQYLETFMKFIKREGHANVPQRHSEDGLKLGLWVNNLRHGKNQIQADRLKLLNSLNFPWDPYESSWESNFKALLKFRNREGDTLVPKGHTESGVKLSSWVVSQRAKRKKMQPARRKRLDDIGFCWDPHGDHWESNFTALVKFQKREGHTRVPSSQIEKGLKLGVWALNIRRKFKTLSTEQIKRLNSLGFSTNPRDEIWEQYYLAVRKFRQREGHFRVKRNHTEDGLKLGTWMQNQRSHKDKLSNDRLKKLNSILFTWDMRVEQWEYAFNELTKFVKREGHCKVPTYHEQGDIKLGKWVSTQRLEYNELSRDKITRLNSLGFVWDSLAEKWNHCYLCLKEYAKKHGHTRVPAGTKIGQLSLGKWVSRQRLNKAQLSPDRLKLLNSLGFIWKP
jgi:superfamily II DNA or RNA helicase